MEWESEKPGHLLKNLEAFRQNMVDVQAFGLRCCFCQERTHDTMFMKCGMFIDEVGACRSCQESHILIDDSTAGEPANIQLVSYTSPDKPPPKSRGYDHSKFSKQKRSR